MKNSVRGFQIWVFVVVCAALFVFFALVSVIGKGGIVFALVMAIAAGEWYRYRGAGEQE